MVVEALASSDLSSAVAAHLGAERPYLSDEKIRETNHPRESQKVLESYNFIRAPSERCPSAVR